MDDRFKIERGVTLLELVIVIAVMGILLTCIISSGMNSINRAKFQATVREMGSIAQASIDYYNSSTNPNDPNNPQPLQWPGGPSQLTNNISHVVTINPFGFKYQISGANNMVTISTMIPKGILIDPNEGSFLQINQGTVTDQISITQSIPNAFSGRLSYDLQYLDK